MPIFLLFNQAYMFTLEEVQSDFWWALHLQIMTHRSIINYGSSVLANTCPTGFYTLI